MADSLSNLVDWERPPCMQTERFFSKERGELAIFMFHAMSDEERLSSLAGDP